MFIFWKNIYVKGDLWKSLLHAHRSKGLSWPNHMGSLLPTQHSLRCNKLGEKIWQVPNVFSSASLTLHQDDNYFFALAFLLVEDGYFRSIICGIGWKIVHFGCDKILHQMVNFLMRSCRLIRVLKKPQWEKHLFSLLVILRQWYMQR